MTSSSFVERVGINTSESFVCRTARPLPKAGSQAVQQLLRIDVEDASELAVDPVRLLLLDQVTNPGQRQSFFPITPRWVCTASCSSGVAVGKRLRIPALVDPREPIGRNIVAHDGFPESYRTC